VPVRVLKGTIKSMTITVKPLSILKDPYSVSINGAHFLLTTRLEADLHSIKIGELE
jgi:hypothetical protein